MKKNKAREISSLSTKSESPSMKKLSVADEVGELKSREEIASPSLQSKVELIEKKRESGYRFSLVFLLLCFLIPSETLLSQSVIPAFRIDHKITIDGVVDDNEWARIPVLEVSQKVPNAGDPPSQETEIRIAYNEDYLYLSGRMFDTEPDKIVANTKKRDDFTENTGWCGLLIDSYNDRENALAFFVTPTGAKLDMALSNDIQGIGAFNLSWDSFWDSAATRDETGWFAEIRIPFSSLPFEAIDNEVVMGITTFRYLARNDETDIYPARDLSSGSSFRPSLTQRFAFESISEKTPISVTPYLLGGHAQDHTLANGVYETGNDFKRELGLDAKISLGSNATLDLSINTDFAQVEADDQQVNLTRLNLFFPEKRLFFQERAGLFDFNFGSRDKLFHSRRIGIVNGQQTRIYGGARAIGKWGKWEAGLLSMQSGAQASLNSENFSVLRLKRSILNENSKLGVILTHRGDLKDHYNTALGIDGDIRWRSQDFLSFRWAQTLSDESPNNFGSNNSSKFYLELANRSQNGLVYNMNLGRAGEDYIPGVGFEHRFDFTKWATAVAYNIFPTKESSVSQHGPYANSDLTWGNESGEKESQLLQLGYNVLSKSGFTFDLSALHRQEKLLFDIPLTDRLTLGIGDYQFAEVLASVSSPSAGKLSYAATLSAGSFYDGNRVSVDLQPAFNVTPDLILVGNYSINRLDFDQLDGADNIQLSKLKVLYTFSTKLSLSTTVQHNSLTKSFFTSLRFRYNPRDGDNFYFVFNGDVNQDRSRVSPSLPLSNQRTSFVKYSRTIRT